MGSWLGNGSLSNWTPVHLVTHMTSANSGFYVALVCVLFLSLHFWKSMNLLLHKQVRNESLW